MNSNNFPQSLKYQRDVEFRVKVRKRNINEKYIFFFVLKNVKYHPIILR